MDALIDKFQRMGARATVETISPRDQRLRMRHAKPQLELDVRTDRHGEYFHVTRPSQVRIDVLDVWKQDRHLLLMATNESPATVLMPPKSKFLCGHDERHWFVAAVPEQSRSVGGIQQAMDALKPDPVWEAMQRFGVAMSERNERRTAGFVRQGEWFFIPQPGMTVQNSRILKREPISRGRGKPHWCDELYREGGTMVFVSAQYPAGLDGAAYRALGEADRKRHKWRQMARDPRAFVRGRVRHPDHATIVLPFWHQVVMNTENRAAAMRNVVFLD